VGFQVTKISLEAKKIFRTFGLYRLSDLKKQLPVTKHPPLQSNQKNMEPLITLKDIGRKYVIGSEIIHALKSVTLTINVSLWHLWGLRVRVNQP